MKRFLLILASLYLVSNIHADELKSRPVEFGTGSALTIDSGVTAAFLSGSNVFFAGNVDFTGATISGFVTGGVDSFNGRVGTVVPLSGDYNATLVGLGNVTNDAQIKASDFPGSSVDSEIALFNGTGGTSIKRAAGTGLVKETSGVISTITDASANWNTAFTDRMKWDGGSAGLTAATGRASLSLVPGTDVEAWDQQLDDLAALSYGSNALKVVRVNAGATAFELATISTGATAFTGLSDVPNSYTGQSLKAVRVNTGETGLEFYVPAYVPTSRTLTIGGTALDLSADRAWTTDTILGLSGNGFVKRTAANTYTNDTNTYLTGNQTITLTGDTTGSGTTAITTTTSALTGVVTLTANSALTNTPATMMTSNTNSSGTAATGFGQIWKYTMEDSTTNAQNAATVEYTWSDATHATRTSKFTLQLVNSAAALADVFTVSGAGNGTFVGTVGASNLSGTNTGDATLAGENYLTIAGQVITAHPITLSGSNVTGTLGDANIATSANWNTAYTERHQWDGGSTNLVAATGRTSLGATTVGSNVFTLTNPSAISWIEIAADNSVSTKSSSQMKTDLGLVIGTNVEAWDADLDTWAGITPTTVGTNIVSLSNPGAITFLRINADNTVTARSAANFKTDLSLVSSDVGLGSVTNDAQTKAAIVPNTAPSAGQILAGNAGGTAYAPVSVTGDISITSAGVTALGNIPAIAGTNLTGTGASFTAGKATILATARNLWGQSFDGSGAVTGSLTSVGDITGGASNMTITAGTGNSRTLTLDSTTSGGTATPFITGNADQSTTFGGNISGTGGWTLTGGAGNMTIVSGTGNSRTMALQTTTSGGTATTALTLNADQTATFAGNVSIGTGNAFTAGTIELGAASDTTIARSGAGAITVEGAQVLLSGAALGTPASGTMTNVSGTAASLTAGNATKWTTGRTVATTGDVTYTSGSLDGSGNVTGTATVANIPTSATFAHSDTTLPTDTGGWTEYFVTGNDFTCTFASTCSSLADISGLVTGTLTGGAVYEFEVQLRYFGADTGGAKMAFHGAGTGSAATVFENQVQNTSAASSAAVGSINAIDSAGASFVTYAGEGVVSGHGFFTARTTGTDTMSVQIIKLVSGTATVRKGSVLRIRLAHT